MRDTNMPASADKRTLTINTKQAIACQSDMTAEPAAGARASEGKPSDGFGAGSVRDPPAWSGMPEPRPIMVLSWEDVWAKLYDVLGRQPTKEEVTLFFEEVARHMDDALAEDFWIHIEQLAEQQYGGKGNGESTKVV